MSVAALIASMGKSVAVRRPTNAKNPNGTVERTMATTLTTTAFVQERSSGEQVAQGRDNRRNQTVIYFDGSADVRTDDYIAVPPTGTVSLYRVTGVRVPDLATLHPSCHTIVDAIRVEPVGTI